MPKGDIQPQSLTQPELIHRLRSAVVLPGSAAALHHLIWSLSQSSLLSAGRSLYALHCGALQFPCAPHCGAQFLSSPSHPFFQINIEDLEDDLVVNGERSDCTLPDSASSGNKGRAKHGNPENKQDGDAAAKAGSSEQVQRISHVAMGNCKTHQREPQDAGHTHSVLPVS